LYTPQGNLLLVINDIEISDTNTSVISQSTSSFATEGNTTKVAPPSTQKVSAIILVPSTKQIPSLINLQQSHAAHYWDTIEQRYEDTQNTSTSIQLQQQQVPYILYTDDSSKLVWLGGIAISSNQRSLYGCAEFRNVPTTQQQQQHHANRSIVIFELSLDTHDDGDEDDDDRDGSDNVKTQNEIKIIVDLTEYCMLVPDQELSYRPAAMVMGQRSGVLYVTVPDGVVLIDPIRGSVISHIPIVPLLLSPTRTANAASDSTRHIPTSEDSNTYTSPNTTLALPTAMTLGGDGYLYIAANYHHLYRIRTKDRPIVF
jgi:hypothetical protein